LELLLIFSALLSSLTGALTGVRAPEQRLHHAAALESVAVEPSSARPARIVAVRSLAPAVARPRHKTQVGLAFALSLPVPLEMVRLLE
jgi:hypothetical protein